MSLTTNVPGPLAKFTSNVLAHRAEWALVDALNGGTPAMRAAGKLYLPQDAKEVKARYETRLMRSVLDNYYSEAVDRGVDKIFTQDIRLINQPGEIQIFTNDVDAQGRDLTQFCKDVLKKSINHGVSYILTDYTALPKGGFENRAQELAARGRPYWVSVQAPQVIQLTSEIVNGQECLSVFKWETEATFLDENGLDWVTTQEVRTLTRPVTNGVAGRVRFQVERLIRGQWVPHDQGELPSSIIEIPVRAVYANREGFYMGSPVFMSLAEMNVQHYQKRSDIENILHIVNVPFLFGKGFDRPGNSTTDGRPIKPRAGETDAGPTLEVDVHNAIMTSKTDGDIKWIEHTGTAVSIALDDIKNMEARMKELGSALFTSASGGGASATEKAINAAEANARLKSIALALQDALELCLVDVVRYMGISLAQNSKLQVNTAYSMDFVADSTFPSVISLFRMGLLTWEVVIAEAKRRNIIGLDVEVLPPAVPVTTADTGVDGESVTVDKTVTDSGTVASSSVI